MDFVGSWVSSSIAGMPAMLLGEPGRRYPTDAAVGPDLVVVDSPAGDFGARLVQALKPVLVEALVSELAVEAFDVAVLQWTPRLDQDVLDAMLQRPSDVGPAGELWTVVSQLPRALRPLKCICVAAGWEVQESPHSVLIKLADVSMDGVAK